MSSLRSPSPFNTPLEVGLRTLVVLREAFPNEYTLQRLVYFDYFVVHTDDLDGPPGLHPQTPHRSGELLVRRRLIQAGLALYRSRSLLAEHYGADGICYAATELSGGFLASLTSDYVNELQNRAHWVVEQFGGSPLHELADLVSSNVGEWGAEFEFESVLWEDDQSG